MNTVLEVLIWLAETVDRLLSMGWWLVAVLAPGGAVGGWLWLRPTGKHRRPRPSRFNPPAEAAAPAMDADTAVLQRAVHSGGEADS
ncbi:hypothetical protein [Streptomyces sp. NPDC006334]|uniref:hypothetical protein n=1 Tax=Streptomyces sp. NPDC006334 TaxID=3156754 RepID=UPI0033AC2035